MVKDFDKAYNREEGVKLLCGFVNALILSGIFWVVYHWIDTSFTLHNSLKFKVTNSPLSLVTSLFIHNSLTHLHSNILVTILFGTIFFYYKGIFKGYGYFILSGVIGHLLEIVFAIPLNFLLRIYLEGLKTVDLSYIGFFIMHPSGAGASGGIAGMMAIVAFELYRRFNRAYREFNNLNKSRGRWSFIISFSNVIVYFVLFIYPVLLLVERTTADLDALCYLLYHSFMINLDSDLISASISFITDLIPSNNDGNPFLAHILGMFGGILIIINEQLKFMGNFKDYIAKIIDNMRHKDYETNR